MSLRAAAISSNRQNTIVYMSFVGYFREMGHLRERYLNSILLADLRWSPAVALFGMRQTGKTTLSELITKQQGGVYETFDNQNSLERAKRMTLQFCERSTLLTIDESQKVPEIFTAIKGVVGTRRKAGRFLLTGSIRFTLRKEIREALTGRILIRELFPFSLSEIDHCPPDKLPLHAFIELSKKCNQSQGQPQILEKYFESKKLPTEKNILTHCLRGGLPIPCFTRDTKRRSAWFDSYIETLLTRDLVWVDKKLANIPLQQLKAFLKVLAQHQGTEVNALDLAARSGLRPDDVKRLLFAHEALCIIERIAPEMRVKKAVKKLRIEWKDVGLRNHVSKELPDSVSDFSWPTVHLAIGQQLRSQLQALGEDPSWTFYRSRDGASIPWIIRTRSHCLAFIYVPDEVPKPYDYRILRNFLEEEPKATGIILGAPRAQVSQLDKRIWLIPWQGVF